MEHLVILSFEFKQIEKETILGKPIAIISS